MLLVVDDDPEFLENAEESLGQPMLLAADADQAKTLLAMMCAEFSLVLIDLDMPGQNGFSLIRELQESFPGLPVIAISGVFSLDVLNVARCVGAVDVLQKPISAGWVSAVAAYS